MSLATRLRLQSVVQDHHHQSFVTIQFNAALYPLPQLH